MFIFSVPRERYPVLLEELNKFASDHGQQSKREENLLVEFIFATPKWHSHVGDSSDLVRKVGSKVWGKAGSFCVQADTAKDRQGWHLLRFATK